MGMSECCICEENDYLKEYHLEGNVLWVCRSCVEFAIRAVIAYRQGTNIMG